MARDEAVDPFELFGANVELLRGEADPYEVSELRKRSVGWTAGRVGADAYWSSLARIRWVTGRFINEIAPKSPIPGITFHKRADMTHDDTGRPNLNPGREQQTAVLLGANPLSRRKGVSKRWQALLGSATSLEESASLEEVLALDPKHEAPKRPRPGTFIQNLRLSKPAEQLAGTAWEGLRARGRPLPTEVDHSSLALWGLADRMTASAHISGQLDEMGDAIEEAYRITTLDQARCIIPGFPHYGDDRFKEH